MIRISSDDAVYWKDASRQANIGPQGASETRTKVVRIALVVPYLTKVPRHAIRTMCFIVSRKRATVVAKSEV